MSIFSFSHLNKTRYSTFNMSHDVKLSCEMGQLVPFLCEEILPGDKWKVTSESLVRMAPMLAPLMHRVDVRTEYFFVPNRIITPAWEKVMFPKPNKAPDMSLPYINFEDFAHLKDDIQIATDGDVMSEYAITSWQRQFSDVGWRKVKAFDPCSLADYLGVCVGADGAYDEKINLLPFLAYQRIYNDYYRDENLDHDLSDMQDGEYNFSAWDAEGFGLNNSNNLFDLEGNLSYGQGSDSLVYGNALAELLQLRNRCWEKDYFTSALPWRQAGPPAVAPLQFDTNGRTYVHSGGSKADFITGASGTNLGSQGGFVGNTPVLPNVGTSQSPTPQLANLDNSSALGLSIADLQTASWLQRFLENIALGGHRMVEQILSHFGVRVPDYRLDRAEYLGGNRTPLGVSPIYQTSSSVEGSPLANPSGQAKSMGVNKAVTRTFEEHGWLIGIVSVIPRTTYSQGLARKFSRFDRLDFAWPEFAMLGEQEVKMKEVFLNLASGSHNDDPFGYQQRYADYKYINSTVHGDFADTLDFWHMSREFQNAPNLNSSFVKCNPTDRIWSVPSATNHIWMMIHNNVLANRPLPQISNSSLA